MNEPHSIIDASIDIWFSIHPFLGRIDPCACVLLSGSVFSSPSPLGTVALLYIHATIHVD